MTERLDPDVAPSPRAPRGLHLVGQTDGFNRECAEHHPQRTRVLLFGSSITFGNLRAMAGWHTRWSAS